MKNECLVVNCIIQYPPLGSKTKSKTVSLLPYGTYFLPKKFVHTFIYICPEVYSHCQVVSPPLCDDRYMIIFPIL